MTQTTEKTYSLDELVGQLGPEPIHLGLRLPNQPTNHITSALCGAPIKGTLVGRGKLVGPICKACIHIAQTKYPNAKHNY